MAVSSSRASILHFIVTILFLSGYNVSLRVSRSSFFNVNVATWHSNENSERKKERLQVEAY